MPKELTKYESDTGEIHPIIIDDATTTAVGTPPAGAVTNNIKAKVSRSKREFGLRPRGLRLGRRLGTAPDTFIKYAFCPILTPTAFAAIAVDDDLLYRGANYKVIAKIGELPQA